MKADPVGQRDGRERHSGCCVWVSGDGRNSVEGRAEPLLSLHTCNKSDEACAVDNGASHVGDQVASFFSSAAERRCAISMERES